MHRNRLNFALKETKSSDWARFEQFASAFLSSEYPAIRTMAHPSGDEGRDAELFSPEGETTVMLQYSVAMAWDQKIKGTAKKIKKNFPHVTDLIYVTNQEIGAKGDEVKKTLRKDYKLRLDIFDKNYFLDRYEGDDHRETVAASFARDIADPILEKDQVLERKPQKLNHNESRAALVFLEMQWEDDSREKGLTKLAFDGLVKMALRNTSSNELMPREEIHKSIIETLANQEQKTVIDETNKSLNRLTKKIINHHTINGADSFCLKYEEYERLREKLAENAIQDQKLKEEIKKILRAIIPASMISSEDVELVLCDICMLSIEKFLLNRGESFVHAINNGQMDKIGFEGLVEITKVVLNDYDKTLRTDALLNLLAAAVERVLSSPSDSINHHIKGLADSYTMLAFLRETPDVQAAVKKIFSEGEIWLDTSAILPLFAEELLDEEDWQFKKLIKAAHSAGLKLKVTSGVIEEVERHMNRSIACSLNIGTNNWNGSYPYLFSFYIASGAAPSAFNSWVSKFRGTARPEDDVADYINEFFQITMDDISEEVESVDAAYRIAVKEEWIRIHEGRRTNSNSDNMLALRLAEHDTENFVGVISRRRQKSDIAFGYTSWWLTLDQMAFSISSKVNSNYGGRPQPSPVMSADFLSNYLSFGPTRNRVSKDSNAGLPIALDPALVSYISPELVQIADSVRASSAGLDEHIIRRRVRDALDSARRRIGKITQNGLSLGLAVGDAS